MIDESVEGSGSLTIAVLRVEPGIRVLTLAGWYRRSDADLLLHRVGAELALMPALLVLDLSALSGLDPAGVDAITGAAERAVIADVRMCLVDPHGHLPDSQQPAAVVSFPTLEQALCDRRRGDTQPSTGGG